MPGICKIDGKGWYGFYRGPRVVSKNGKLYRKTIKVFLSTDKSAAQALLARLLKDIEHGRAGLLDEYADSRHRQIEQHIDDYTASREARVSPLVASVTDKRVRRICAAGCIKTVQDLTSERVQRALAVIAKEPVHAALKWKTVRFPTVGSINQYLISIKTFSKWLVEHRRIESDPLAKTKKLSMKRHERRHVRRALTVVELKRLIAAAERGKEYFGLSGPDRAMLYRVACTTGLRASELASLTPASFDLDAGVVLIDARNAKNGKPASLPVPVARLRKWLKKRPKHEPCWPGEWATRKHGAEMMRKDLQNAGLPYETEEGIADFHALRTAFISNLARDNVPLVFAQKLARHSTPVLTANVYTRIKPHELADSVANLRWNL